MFLYKNLTTGRWHVNDKPKSSSSATPYDTVALRNVTFRVSEKVRLWCIANATNGKPYRQVHAYAVGDVVPVSAVPQGTRTRISYNPARCGTFYRVDTGAAITACEYVLFDADGAWAIGQIN